MDGEIDWGKESQRVMMEQVHQKKMQIKQNFIELTTGRDPQWGRATENLVNYVMDNLKLYTTKSDTKPEIWVYKEGVYVPDGKSEVMQILRDLLGDRYSQFVLNKVIEKIQPDTFIEPDLFFNQNHKWEIPLLNGILNIQEMNLYDFDDTKIFFNKLPVTYEVGADCPEIDSFLKEILSNSEDVKVYYEMVGFCLLKEYTFEKAFMLVGNGRNGKGKAMELIKRLIGIDNTCSVPLNTLQPDSFLISELHNKMVNLAGDISNKDLKDTSMFKSCTGRDLIGAKRKFLNNINFENYAKFIFACNELPMVYDLSRGFWDRWELLEFPYTFVTEEEYRKAEVKDNLKIRDEDIINKISTEKELSGLLNMALIGLHRLLNQRSFSSTKGTEDVKKMWIRKSNSFIAFCDEWIEEDYEGYIRKKDLRKIYAKYCKENKATPKSDIVIKNFLQQSFGAFEERQVILEHQEHVWTGIKLKENIK